MENTEAAKGHKTGMARLWELAFRKKALVITSCLFSVISVAVSFTPFIAVYFLIRELVIHFADLGGLDRSYMIKLGVLAAGGAAAAVFLNFIALMCSHVAAFTTLYDLKLEFTRHIASLPLGFHTENSTGKLRKIVDENIEKLEGFIAHQLPDLAGSFAMPVFTLVILFVFDWRLGLASLVPIILSYLIQMIAFSGKEAQTFINKYQNSLEDMNNAAVEYVRGISVVKVFNQTIYSFRKFYHTIKEYGNYVLNYTMSFELFMVIFMLIINQVYLFLIPVIILIAGAAAGTAEYAAFAMTALFYLIFSVSLSTPFTKLMYVSQNGKMIQNSIERMDQVLDTPPLAEPVSPKTTDEYSVAFEQVTFSYSGGSDLFGEGGETAALREVSFTARQGEVTALVGPSGSGKSTLAHLIPRFYEVTGGAVKIGGVDIRDMASEYLMSLVSFVFQEVFLFKQSIIDNILIGNKNASREEAIAAAKAAQCHDFVEKLPQGYDTVIGTKNIHLSGGERQRLVIARAILKNAPIIVLDEATAFADPENEQKIQRAFEKLIKNKTVIIIAHRLSTVRGADKIVVIDKGRLVEEGTHDTLVPAQGRYSRMWEQYTGAMKWTLAG
ncbi:MAG: ABC transporter ATP-binding protein/permease [Spirochaetaceae bacterium]|jgi:ATP-binding cassette subfamily B protein|nr:ABC transporter ATP-binding protein/permease [Spirochaetaceae bacterium]